MASRTINVSNSTQLAAAIRISTGGETINLNSGNYGNLVLYQFKPTSMVTIREAPNAKAAFAAVTFNTVNNVTFDGFNIGRPLLVNETPLSGYQLFVGNSTNVNFRNLDIHGTVNHNPLDDKSGMRLDNSRDVQIDSTKFHDLNVALWINKSSAVALTNSEIYEVREGLDMSGVQHVLIDHNLIHSVIPNYALDSRYTVANGDHPDMIQLWTRNGAGGSDDVTISNNALLLGRGMDTHGIFMWAQEETSKFTNFVIENNLITTNNYHGISIEDMVGGIVRGNTVQQAGNTFAPSINVKDSRGIEVSDNIAPGFNFINSVDVDSTNNIRVTGSPGRDTSGPPSIYLSSATPRTAAAVDVFTGVAGRADPSGAGFDPAVYQARISFDSYDAIVHALHAGASLYHIA